MVRGTERAARDAFGKHVTLVCFVGPGPSTLVQVFAGDSSVQTCKWSVRAEATGPRALIAAHKEMRAWLAERQTF